MKIEININGSPVEITLTEDQIKTVNNNKPFKWQDVTSIDYLYENVKDFQLPYSFPETKLQERLNAHYKISTAIELINEGWVPDWKDTNQYKWRIWVEWNTSKNGFSSDVGYVRAFAVVGSDLLLPTEELAEHILKHFESDFLELLT